MADIIQLLPEAIANQIAAGEVVQRPASVVKELVENAIDAGSSEIKVVIKDAGKTLIQIIDNGCGMSERDARMAFERHATSKIREAKDLFAIRTMGFRGEALASIAAIAQVELKTRRQTDELGVRLMIEGSRVVEQGPCQCTSGSNFAIKNLFYNVPARRQFLKSDNVEFKHILDEFQRLAIANADIFFSLHHNGTEIFHLNPGNLRQRIVGIFGTNVNKKLVPIGDVGEEEGLLKLNGFVGKPEFAKKTRGEQYIYVNHRFIKSGFLNHAITTAFEDLLPKGHFPLYVIFIELDPAKIDINVHPTKQEIKFDDERMVYKVLKVAVRHGLGKHNIIPTLDFEQERIITHPTPSPRIERQPNNTGTNPSSGGSNAFPNVDFRQAQNLKRWEDLYKDLESVDETPKEEKPQEPQPVTIPSRWDDEEDSSQGRLMEAENKKMLFQIHQSFIISQIRSGFMLINQQAAHERILYEKYLDVIKNQPVYSQKALFPKEVQFSKADAVLLHSILPLIQRLGFDIEQTEECKFIINGSPADLVDKRTEQVLLEGLLEQYKENIELQLGQVENLARSMAKSSSIKARQSLGDEEMQELVDKLFACDVPFKSPSGNKCFFTISLEEIEDRFL